MPSPVDKLSSKKVKSSSTDQYKTYSDAASAVFGVAVVRTNKPDIKVDAELEVQLRREVRPAILAIEAGAKPHNFICTYMRVLTLVFACADEATSIWLRALVGEMRIDGKGLRALGVGDLTKRHRVVLHAPELCQVPPKEVL